MAKNSQPTTTAKTTTDVVEEVQTVETQPEVTPVVEAASEPTPVEQPAVVEPVPVKEPVKEESVLPTRASTPLMRLMEQQSSRNTNPFGEKTKASLTEQVKATYGDEVANHPHIQYLVSVLSEYVEKMSPNASVTEYQGGELQAKLARVYDAALAQQPELSQISLQIIVDVVKDNLTLAFGQNYALRFANVMPLSQPEALRFQNLTILFITLAGGVQKKDLAKHINPRKMLDYIPNANAKANLSEFIN